MPLPVFFCRLPPPPRGPGQHPASEPGLTAGPTDSPVSHSICEPQPPHLQNVANTGAKVDGCWRTAGAPSSQLRTGLRLDLEPPSGENKHTTPVPAGWWCSFYSLPQAFRAIPSNTPGPSLYAGAVQGLLKANRKEPQSQHLKM